MQTFHLLDNILQIESLDVTSERCLRLSSFGLFKTERSNLIVYLSQQTLTDSSGLSHCSGSWYPVSFVNTYAYVTYASQSSSAAICLTAFPQPNVILTGSFDVCR